MMLPVLDFTTNRSDAVARGVDRWNTALAQHGRACRLVYQRESPAACGRRIEGTITVCDSETSATEFGEGGYDWDARPWKWGYVSLTLPASATQATIDAVVVHELGHCLGLNHRPDGSDSVMTDHVHLTNPTASDCAGVLPYLDTQPSTPQPSPPPPPAKPKKKKKHKGHH